MNHKIVLTIRQKAEADHIFNLLESIKLEYLVSGNIRNEPQYLALRRYYNDVRVRELENRLVKIYSQSTNLITLDAAEAKSFLQTHPSIKFNVSENNIDVESENKIDEESGTWMSACLDIPDKSDIYLTQDVKGFISMTCFSTDLFSISESDFNCYRNYKVSGWYRKNDDGKYTQVTDIARWFKKIKLN